MGRLFWKIFLFVWLGQMAAVAGTGLLFWLERQSPVGAHAHPPPAHRPGAGAGPPHPGPPRPPPRGPHLPVVPVLAGVLASIACAAGLAWYFARPIRRLRQGFDEAARGNLAVRVGAGMGGRRDELVDLGHDFDRMTERLAAMVDSQQRLLHDVSHELRSPLARLQAAAGLARQQPERLDETLQRIERESERMNRLISELLTLSRLEAGALYPAEAVDLEELLVELIDDARFEADARQIRIESSIEAPIILPISGELLHRAIENVLRNAIRFSPAGGLIRVTASRDGASACLLSIEDGGRGVPAADLPHLFEPFWRSGTNRGEGYGLGLAIAQRIVTASGGRIVAENRAEGGLVVKFYLPGVPS